MQTQQKKPKFDRPLVKEATVEKEMLNPSSVIAPNLFSLEDALRKLEDVREDAEKAYASDDHIDPVPDSAYDHAHALLELLHRKK